MVGINVRDGVRARALVQSQNIAGILVRGTPRGTDTKLLQSIASARTDVPTMVAVDEEGGRVQHLRKAIGIIPSAKTMAATMTPPQVRALARRHGLAMRKMGFTVVFGPVLDLQFGPDKGGSNGIGDRGFSGDPTVVTEFAGAFAEGMLDAGLYPVVKHFPGGGRADGDPHYKGTESPSIDELRKLDLVPFENLLRTLPIGVMSGHQEVPGLDPLPASLSPQAITGILRVELNFTGLAVTDSLSMWSIAYNFDRVEAATLALKAGNDLLLFDDEPNVDAIISGLSESIVKEPGLHARLVNAVADVFRAKGIPQCPGTLAQLPTPGGSTSPTTTRT
jgi:beta-N-acetylhexosaminidase